MIIADDLRDGRSSRSSLAYILSGAAALAVGLVALLVYGQADMTLSHYDARAHLVVARRIIDSLTPGWRQIGAIWLPLPHLLNALPVQIDLFYRTGASAIAISVFCFAVGTAALARLLLDATGSAVSAAVGATIVALNPNLLYLQATPMTEPLLFALVLLGVAGTYRWVQYGATGYPLSAGLALAGACLTRYEAWAITPLLATGAGFVLWHRGAALAAAASATLRLATLPALAIVLFLALSRATVGQWLVTSGFFLRENPAAGHPGMVLAQIIVGLRLVMGHVTVWLTIAAFLIVVIAIGRAEHRRSWILPLVLVAAAALPAYAYFMGHPFRVRYATPLIPAAAVVLGLGVGLLRHGRLAAGVLIVGFAVVESPPFDPNAAMVREARQNKENAASRLPLTATFARSYDGRRILASMGSLAPYMQEASAAGFRLRDFVHEGNGEIWTAALDSPARHVGWILIKAEEREGRDALVRAATARPSFFHGFERVTEAGGVTLYRRTTPE